MLGLFIFEARPALRQINATSLVPHPPVQGKRPTNHACRVVVKREKIAH
jgi:hypothetical protein